MKSILQKIGILVILLAGCGAAISIAMQEYLVAAALLVIALVAIAVEEFLTKVA
jgi:hypothetical protein